MSDTTAADSADLGVLEHGHGEVTLRFTRRLPHPPAKVWRALTEPEHLAAWFPTTVEGDLTPGSALRYNFREMNLPGFDGSVLACDPPALLELNWGDERLRFELTADGQGTVLTFSASFAEIGRAPLTPRSSTAPPDHRSGPSCRSSRTARETCQSTTSPQPLPLPKKISS